MAALAVGAITAMADTSNVYSLNIVGYVNVTIPFGNSLLANPLDNGAGNSASAVLSLAPLADTYATPAGTLNSFTISTWNGASFDSAYYESDFTSNVTGPNGGYPAGPTNGWAPDLNGATALAAPVLAPGKGFFIANPTAVITNTWVGTVVPAPGTTTNMAIGFGNSLIASVLPVSGALNSSALNFPLAPLNDTYATPAGTLNSVTISTWNGASFDTAYYESDFTSNVTGPNGGYSAGPTNGWAPDLNGAVAIPAPVVNVGYGFFIANPTALATWSQSL
jgi:hypothetical protein